MSFRVTYPQLKTEDLVVECFRGNEVVERREMSMVPDVAITACEQRAMRRQEVVLYRRSDRFILWSNRLQNPVGEKMPDAT